MSSHRINVLRLLARRLPSSLVVRLNQAQFRHARAGRLLRSAARVVASGETVIDRGPAAGLRIDATGSNAGYAIGTAELDEQEWLRHHLEPGDVFFDIGANIGFFTLLGGRLVGDQGAVVAFEPLPENLAQLGKNLTLNELDQVTVVAAAVSDTPGNSLLSLQSDRRDAAHLVTSDEDNGPTLAVEVVTIDQWLHDGFGRRPPTVLKIDVEGAEINVLRGAAKTLREWRPTVLVEVHWLGQAFIDFVDHEVVPLGYRANQMDGNPLTPDLVRYHAVLESA